MTQKYDRFKSAPWFQEGTRPPVLIGGAGGIGSWLTVLLNRAGFETYVYDMDILEEINMAGQLFAQESIGKTKVDALDDIVFRLCQEHIIPNFSKVDKDTMSNDIVFSAFDNMEARKDMFNSWLTANRGSSKAIFIDGRLTAEQLTIFSIIGNNENSINEYLTEHLFSDDSVADLPCTFKQTSHGAAMIASHMLEMFTNWYAGLLGKDMSRSTPFFWEYMIPIGFTSCREAINSSEQENVSLETDKYPLEVLLGEATTEKTNQILEEQEVVSSIDSNLTFEEIAAIDSYIEEEEELETLEASSPSDSFDFEEERSINPVEYPSPTIDDDLPL